MIPTVQHYAKSLIQNTLMWQKALIRRWLNNKEIYSERLKVRSIFKEF